MLQFEMSWVRRLNVRLSREPSSTRRLIPDENQRFIVKIFLISRMSFLSIYGTIVRTCKMVSPNKSKQLGKHPESITKAKRKVWWFAKSKIKLSCYTKSQSLITPLISYAFNVVY